MKFVFWCSNEQRQFRLAELDAIIHMLGLQASVAIHPPFGLPSFKIIFSGLFSFKINVFRLSSFKIKMFRMSSFKIKKIIVLLQDQKILDCPPSKVEWLVRSSSLPWVALNLSTEEEAKAILERCPIILPA